MYSLFIISELITKKQLLWLATKNKGIQRAKLLLRKLLVDRQSSVLWTYEKLFTVQAIHCSKKIGFGRKTMGQSLLNSELSTDILPTGHFADRYFIVRHFADREYYYCQSLNRFTL